MSFDTLDADPNKPFVFAAAKVVSIDVTPDQVSAAIPDTGLKSHLAAPATDNHSVHVHTSGHGEGPKANGVPHTEEEFDEAQDFFDPYREDAPHSKALEAAHEHNYLERSHTREFPDAPLGHGKPEQASAQEGATGAGPGGHENELSPALVEGQEDYDPHRLYTFPNGDPMTIPHDKLMKRFKDEAGRAPLPLHALKREEPPGSRNEIILDPRVVHLQVGLKFSTLGY